MLCWVIEQFTLFVHSEAADKQDLPNCPGFGQAGSLLLQHGPNRASPCFSTSSELWWHLGLLAASLHPAPGVPPGQSLQTSSAKCLRQKAAILEKEV